MKAVRLNSECLGKGQEGKVQPLVLLHGWAHNIEIIRPLAELLSQTREVHLIDLPGHGKSETPEEIWGMEQFAHSVLEYLERNQLSTADFVGHSFGGKTIIKLNSIDPTRAKKIVLISSSGLKPKRALKKRLQILGINKLRWVVKLIDKQLGKEIFRNWFVPKFASPDYLNAGPLRQSFVKTVNEELHVEATLITCPTLLLWGENDTETPIEMARRFLELIPNSKLISLPGKGHEPFHGPGAHLCSHHITNFLNQDSAAAVNTNHA